MGLIDTNILSALLPQNWGLCDTLLPWCAPLPAYFQSNAGLAVIRSCQVVCIYAAMIHNETLFQAKPSSQWWEWGRAAAGRVGVSCQSPGMPLCMGHPLWSWPFRMNLRGGEGAGGAGAWGLACFETAGRVGVPWGPE